MPNACDFDNNAHIAFRAVQLQGTQLDHALVPTRVSRMSDNPVSHIRLGKHKLVEYEVAKEQCSALGRAGRALTKQLTAYANDRQQGFQNHTEAQHVERLTEAAMALMMSREYLGFHHANLEWIMQEFDLPDAVKECLVIPKPEGYLGRSGR